MSDLIERQAAIDAYKNLRLPIYPLEELPSVTTQPCEDAISRQLGKWELVYRDCGIEYYLCRKCHEGKVAIDGDYYKNITEIKYCPNCGAFLGGNEDAT